MKQLFFTLCLLILSPLPTSAWQVIGSGVSGTTPPTYLLTENFTGTSLPAGWTLVSGAPVYNSGGVQLNAATNALTTAVSKTFTASGETWIYYLYTPTASTSNLNAAKAITLIYNNTAIQCTIQAVSTGVGQPIKLRVVMGTASATTADTLSIGTAYQVCVHLKKGAGSDGIADVAFVAGSGELPTSGGAFAALSTGSTQLDANKLALYVEYGAGVGTDATFANVRVDDVPIYSNPL